MADAILVALGFVLVIVVPLHAYVVWQYAVAVRAGARIASLTLAFVVVACLAVAAAMFALLGIQSIWFVMTGARLLPSPIPTLFIAIGALAVSVPIPFVLRQLRVWSRERGDLRAHKRIGDSHERFHRRADDEQ